MIHFAIVGWPGTGTTSLAKALQKELARRFFDQPAWDIVQGGDLFRQAAKAKYPDLSEEAALALFESDAQSNPATDKAVDERTSLIAAGRRPTIVEARLAGMFMPYAYSILCCCDTYVAGKRVARRQANIPENDPVPTDLILEAIDTNRKRTAFASARYSRLYGLSGPLSSQRSSWQRVYNTARTENTPENMARDIVDDWILRNYPTWFRFYSLGASSSSGSAVPV